MNTDYIKWRPSIPPSSNSPIPTGLQRGVQYIGICLCIIGTRTFIWVENRWCHAVHFAKCLPKIKPCISLYDYLIARNWIYSTQTCVILPASIPQKDQTHRSNVKCRYLKTLTRKGTLRQVFICLSSPPLLGFFLGGKAILWVLNLVRNRVLNSCRIWSPTQLNTPLTPSQPHTVCMYCTLILGRGGGELNQRDGQRGNSSQSWVENTNMTDCTQCTCISNL